MRPSIIEAQCELNQPRVVARRDDAPEIAGIPDNLTGIRVNSGGGNCVEVADRVGEVDVVEQVEELSAELNVLCLSHAKAFDDREVHVGLSRPAQGVATDVADVGAVGARDGCSVRAWNQLTGSHDWPDEGETG